MTTITLGVGAEAVEVEDGADVPMIGLHGGCSQQSDRRGVVRLVDGIPCVTFGAHPRVLATVIPETGSLTQWSVKVDLAALRRERAPKVEALSGWSAGQSGGTFDGSPVWIIGAHKPPSDLAAQYWTSRKANTPEKQAAFDAAVDAWVDRVREHISGPCTNPETVKMWHACRALGYGAKR